MTLNCMGGTYNCIIDDPPLRQTRQTAIYKWLRNRPEGKQALHNIKLTFKPAGIWNIFSNLNTKLSMRHRCKRAFDEDP